MGQADLEHFVHAVVPDGMGVRIVADQVVILIVPGQRPGADMVAFAIPLQAGFFFYRPLEVLEGNLHVGGNRRVDFVYIIIDALVHGLDAAGDGDLALQLPGLIAAGQLLELSDQLVGFFGGNKTGSLHGIDEQL